MSDQLFYIMIAAFVGGMIAAAMGIVAGIKIATRANRKDYR